MTYNVGPRVPQRSELFRFTRPGTLENESEGANVIFLSQTDAQI
jgi:hypothetical protein